MMKKIIFILFASFVLSACNGKSTTSQTKTNTNQQRQLINELPIAQRPFLAIFPHTSGKLLTLYLDNLENKYNSVTLDLEYLAGNSLKGGRTSANLPITLPFARAFLLGSCSSGGKCSFDTDLQTGTIKTKLEANNQPTQVLKSDFIFVTGAVSSPDGRVAYQPNGKKFTDQILLDTQGLPKAVDGQLAYAPIAIGETTNAKVKGALTLKVNEVKSVMVYDGTTYQNVKAEIKDGEVKIAVDRDPWTRVLPIVRDDLKGANETQAVYMVGPYILLK